MARGLNFQQVAAFRAVMQMGTTTRAAAMLNTTQPSISRRIAELQSATDLKLFELHHGRLRPTSEGKLLYETVERHFDGLEKIEVAAAVLSKSGTGALRLGCTPTLGIGLLPRVINRFLGKYPNTYVNIQTLSTRQLADYLHRQLIDLALTTGVLDRGDFQPTIIRTSAAVCVLPLHHRLADFPVIDLDALKGDRIILLSEAEEITIRIKALLMENNIPDDFVIETTSSITVCALVAAGNGIGIVNPYVANTFSDQLSIRAFVPSIDIPVQMAMPYQRAPSLLTRHFVEVLMQYARTM